MGWFLASFRHFFGLVLLPGNRPSVFLEETGNLFYIFQSSKGRKEEPLWPNQPSLPSSCAGPLLRRIRGWKGVCWWGSEE